MKIGILSETHGHVARTRIACDLLTSQGTDIVIHCGDIGSEPVLAELLAAFQPNNIPFYAVLGNVDYPDNLYDGWSKAGEFEVMGRFGELTVDGKRIAIIHGDDNCELWKAEADGTYDYIFTGHTHVKEDRTSRNTRIINPGAVYRASQPSVAILETGTDKLTFLAV